jgi:hypothetical protein
MGVKSSHTQKGTIETSIGELELIKGHPSDTTIENSKIEMDFQRAIRAYLWGLPMVEMA